MQEKLTFPVFENTGISPYCLKEAERCCFSRGEDIVLPAGIGLVTKGKVKVTSFESGALLNVIPSGGMFGASTLFAGRDLAGTRLTAEGETGIIFISEASFASLLQENGRLLTNYLGFVSKRICFLSGKVGTLSSSSAEDKLYSHLLQNGGSIRVKSMTQLSKMLSIGRASLYRAMDSLEQSGKIKRNDKEIHLI